MRIQLGKALLTALLGLVSGPMAAARAQVQPPPPYRDPGRPVEGRVRDLLGRMTPEEKFWQLYMVPGNLDAPSQDWSKGVFGLQVRSHSTARAHAERINAIQRYFVERTRLGIPIIPFEEAVHGLVSPGATVFPQAISLAASWDTALVERVARAIAQEARTRGIRQVLSPVLNVANDVRWGRVEETYGEDPILAAAMARAFIGPFETAGVITTPKHFLANAGDGGRDSYPIDLDQRLLEELYAPPFRAAVMQARARSIMSAYNSVDGIPATQNRSLLTGLLRQKWGFQGFVISDAAATGGAVVLHHTEPNTPTAAAHAWEAGLDVVFQSSWDQHRPYLQAIRDGLVPDSVIDRAVSRVLRAKFELGLFEHPYVDPDSTEAGNGGPAHRALALEAARAGMVLLRNEGRLLPLSRSLMSVAVIGLDAAEARLGGYSGPGTQVVSLLQGIRERLGSGRSVRYAPGPGRSDPGAVVVPASQLSSVRGEYFDNPRLEGRPAAVRADSAIDFHWTFMPPAEGLSNDWYSVRWTGNLVVPSSGVRRLGVEGNDGFRLWVDDRLAVDHWRKESYRAAFADTRLLPGSNHRIRLEFSERAGNGRVRLVWDTPESSRWQRQIDSAVAVARRSQVAIVAVGIEEGEFRDRAFLRLPGHQEELIRAVARTGTPVVVVLVGGSAVTMPWLDQVGAVLDIWYPGEAGGRAAAEVLFGDHSPAGRLPISFPVTEGQLPLSYWHKPTGRGDDYLDLSGQPLFPFGFGLSYTTFEYRGLTIEPAALAPGDTAVVRALVRNTGSRAGDEVVQLYLRDQTASVARPVIELKGFARVHLEPGEEREVTFRLGPEELRLLDRDLRWVQEPGTFRVMVGSSSRDIRLRGDLVVR